MRYVDRPFHLKGGNRMNLKVPPALIGELDSPCVVGETQVIKNQKVLCENAIKELGAPSSESGRHSFMACSIRSLRSQVQILSPRLSDVHAKGKPIKAR